MEEGDGDAEVKDEEAVVYAARSGDRDAWEQLFRRLFPRLRAYAARQVDAAEVDDIVNETMSRAVAGIDRFRPGAAGFDGWVFGIARRVAADHRRRMRRFHRTDAFEVAGNADPQPGDALEQADEHRLIRESFERLSPAERDLLELRIIGGFTAEQAAAILGKRPGAVRTAQSRALAHLRRIMGEEP